MRALAALVATVTLLVPRLARADPPMEPAEPGLHWDEDRPRFQPEEFAITGVVGVEALALYYYVRPQPHPHWVGGILFDDAIRNAVRLRSASALRAAWTASDIVNVTDDVLVVGVDSLLVPFFRGSTDVAVQLGLMDVESYALGSPVTISLYDSVGRARPPYQDCQRDPGGPGCTLSPTASFPSGHTAEVFISAGLSCANHLHLPLYGSPLADTLACARDLTLASADGVLRIMGDRHYTTDVLVGATIGFAFGYGLPTILHYDARRGGAPVSWAVTPMTGRQPGVALVGSF